MKEKILIYVALCISAIFAEDERCFGKNEDGMKEGSCEQSVYVCNLGFDVSNGPNVMFFSLGSDPSCETLKTSDLKTIAYPGSSSNSLWLKIFLIEDKYNADPLSLALAGSLALAASNNKERVDVIYEKVEPYEYGGIRLMSISKAIKK